MDARQAVGLSGELVGCSGDVGVLPGCIRTQDRTMLLSFSINQNHPQRLVGVLRITFQVLRILIWQV